MEPSKLWRIAGVFRTVGVGSLGGIAAGLIVGGLGSRIVMRIVGITAGPEMIGAVTENGNRVGDITLAGTMEVVLFVGLFSGILGGLAYVAVRRWLSPFGRWAGLGFGFLLLATFGSGVIERDNFDFHRFGFPVLNVVLFAALFLIFGLVVVPLAEWLDESLPDATPSRPVRIGTLAAYAAMGIGAVLAVLFLMLGVSSTTAALLGFGEELFIPGVLFLCLLAEAVVAHAIHARSGRRPDETSERSPNLTTAVASYAALAIPVLVGSVLTIQAITEILQKGA
jgi:hypothetical protein